MKSLNDFLRLLPSREERGTPSSNGCCVTFDFLEASPVTMEKTFEVVILVQLINATHTQSILLKLRSSITIYTDQVLLITLEGGKFSFMHYHPGQSIMLFSVP